MIDLSAEQIIGKDEFKSFYTTASPGSLLTMNGVGGGGKTTTIAIAISELNIISSNIIFAAPTNKAVRVIENKLRKIDPSLLYGKKLIVQTLHKTVAKLNKSTDFVADLVKEYDDLLTPITPNEFFDKVCETYKINETWDKKLPLSNNLTTILHTLQRTRKIKNGGTLLLFTLKTNENKTIIIDEASMIDNEMAGFIKANLSMGCRVVLVGDARQLPPIEKDYSKPSDSYYVRNVGDYNGSKADIHFPDNFRAKNPIIPDTANEIFDKVERYGKRSSWLTKRYFLPMIPKTLQPLNLQGLVTNFIGHYVVGNNPLIITQKHATKNLLNMCVREALFNAKVRDYGQPGARLNLEGVAYHNDKFLLYNDAVTAIGKKTIIMAEKWSNIPGNLIQYKNIQVEYPNGNIGTGQQFYMDYWGSRIDIFNPYYHCYPTDLVLNKEDENLENSFNNKINTKPDWQGQLTYGYARTCYASQGGDAGVVFVVIEDGKGMSSDTAMLHYYTAITRAVDKVYFVDLKGDIDWTTSQGKSIQQLADLQSDMHKIHSRLIDTDYGPIEAEMMK